MDRRTFVKTGVAATVGLGTAATAGCSNLPLVGSGGGAYTTWAHEPGEVTDRDHYAVRTIDVETVIANEDVFEDDFVDDVESRYDSRLGPTDLDADDVQQVISTNVGAVYLGNFPVDDVIDELEDEGYDDEDDLAGFEIYENEDESRAWGVSSDALVQAFAQNGEAAESVAETVVETSEGEEDRYVEEVEAMEVLSGTLSAGFQQFAFTYDAEDADDPESGDFEDSIGIAGSSSLNGDVAAVEFVVAFEEPDDVDQGDLEDWVDARSGSTFDDVDDVTYSASGRAGVVSGQMDADDITGFL